MGLAALAVLVVVLAGLALFTSFTLEPMVGEPDTSPGGGDEGHGGGQGEERGRGDGGGELHCEDVVRFLFWSFILLLVATLVFFALGVARRDKHPQGFGGSPWGIASIVAMVLTILAFGAWRLIDAICDGRVDCETANNGTFTAFWVLFGLTLAGIGIGITVSHLTRKNFFFTGWGLLGVLLYAPTVLVGGAWYMVQAACDGFMSCAARDAFLDHLAWVFFISIAMALAATVVGWFVQKRYAHSMFKSGWAVLAILLLGLAAVSGAGWLYVDGHKIPGCDPFDEADGDEPPEFPTCEEIQAALQGRLAIGFGALVILSLILFVLALVTTKEKDGKPLRSIWAVLAYIAIGLAVILGLFWLLAGTLCGAGGGGAGAGSGEGPGGGAGGTGDVMTTPLELDLMALLWLVIALAVLAALVVLIVVLARLRRHREETGLPASSMDPQRQNQLMRILAQGKLESRDAVIAAYNGFLSWSDHQGLPIESVETPREHARRVAARCAVPKKELTALVTAYEVVRLSDRQPSQSEQEQAIALGRSFHERTKGVKSS